MTVQQSASTPTESFPSRQCDLVMKGGITSGVVYPAAVMQLKDEFRFRSIGGASAGAIAAVFTAAAEFARESGGFERLDAVRREIGAKDVLRKLFRSSGPTAPLLEALVALTTRSSPRQKLRAAPVLLIRHFGRWVLIGALAGAFVGVLLAWLLALLFRVEWISAREQLVEAWPGTLLVTVVTAIAGAVAGPLLRGLWIGFRHIPRDGGFGLCRGLIRNDPDVLINWLHERIERLAGPGRSTPLTFRDLAGKTPPPTHIGDDKDWRIYLRVMTSNLSHGQPYVFPQPRGGGRTSFIFNANEFRALFPADVVDCLVARDRERAESPRQGARQQVPLADGFHFLPAGDDLPIIVATRMSLSFPLLLSAVPLYTIKPLAWRELRAGTCSRIGLEQLQRNWISDGGISSNFPIHFFDSFLPSRPTFGINLNYLPENFKPAKEAAVSANAFSEIEPVGGDDDSADTAPAEKSDELPEVILPPPAMQRYARPQWRPVTSILDFVGAILATMQGYRDNMQMMLPSYRERIVQIWLRHDEGGMNLDMPEATVQAIDRKGEQAGALLRDQMHFRQHQWVRLRVLLAALEPQLRRMRNNFRNLPSYEALLDEQLAADPSWYKPADRAWCNQAHRRLQLLTDFLDQWADADHAFAATDLDAPAFFTINPPRPQAVLRVTPNA